MYLSGCARSQLKHVEWVLWSGTEPGPSASGLWSCSQWTTKGGLEIIFDRAQPKLFLSYPHANWTGYRITGWEWLLPESQRHWLLGLSFLSTIAVVKSAVTLILKTLHGICFFIFFMHASRIRCASSAVQSFTTMHLVVSSSIVLGYSQDSVRLAIYDL